MARQPHPLVVWLREERRRLRLTQAAVAHRAGYSKRTISAYERGHGEPSFDALTRWAAALGYALTPMPLPISRPPARPGPPPTPLPPITAEQAAAHRAELAMALGIPNTITTGQDDV